jgi:hypothetical protein
MIRFLLSVAIFSTMQSPTKDLVSKEDHFRLKYPARMQVHLQTATDYEKDFNFKSGATQPLQLRVVDLDKYLPQTATPDTKSYVAAFKKLTKYREAHIAGKPVYEYLICGRGSCSQEVVFIHAGRKYEFSIEVPGIAKPDAISFENRPPEIKALVSSIEFDQ